MGLTFSQYMFGLNVVYEGAVGALFCVTGKNSLDPVQAKHLTANDRLWKRVHGTAFVTVAYLGYVGLTTKCKGAKRVVTDTCLLYHAGVVAPMLWALVKDGEGSFKEYVLGNPHVYLTLGFGAMTMGWLK